MARTGPSEERPCRFVTPAGMSFHPFSFPFGDPARVRQALHLQLCSLLGKDAGSVRIHPVILGRDGDRSVGFALAIPPEETPDERLVPGTRLFPAPLALGGSVAPDGLGIWADERTVSCVLWREGIPVLYRHSPRAEGEPEEAAEWIRASAGRDLEVRILDLRDDPGAAEILQAEAEKTWKAFPPLAALDLSKSRMESALRLETLALSAKPALAWLLALGILFSAASGLSYLSSRMNLARYEETSVRLYREVFDPSGPVREPLSQAKARLAAASGQEETGSLAGTLAMLGQAGPTAGNGIFLDTLRFSKGQAELVGRGESVEAIRAFQRAVAPKDASLEELQQLPGGLFRFRLAMKESRQ